MVAEFVIMMAGQKKNAYDEAIIPCDMFEAGIIRDTLIFRNLLSQLTQGVTVTCLIDACDTGMVVDLPYYWSTKGDKPGAVVQMKLNNNFSFFRFLKVVKSLYDNCTFTQIGKTVHSALREQKIPVKHSVLREQNIIDKKQNGDYKIKIQGSTSDTQCSSQDDSVQSSLSSSNNNHKEGIYRHENSKSKLNFTSIPKTVTSFDSKTRSKWGKLLSAVKKKSDKHITRKNEFSILGKEVWRDVINCGLKDIIDSDGSSTEGETDYSADRVSYNNRSPRRKTRRGQMCA